MKPPKVTFKDMWRQFAEAPVQETPVSPQYDKARSCLMKKSHFTRPIADAAAATATKEERVNYVAYKCRWCQHFHIGHERTK